MPPLRVDLDRLAAAVDEIDEVTEQWDEFTSDTFIQGTDWWASVASGPRAVLQELLEAAREVCNAK